MARGIKFCRTFLHVEQRARNCDTNHIHWATAYMSVHWQAQCQAKWLRDCRALLHLEVIKPVKPDSLQLSLTTKLWVCIDLSKKKSIWLVIFCNLEPSFCMLYHFCIVVILRWHKMNQQDLPELINSRHQYMLLHWTQIGVEIFLFMQFLLNAHCSLNIS